MIAYTLLVVNVALSALCIAWTWTIRHARRRRSQPRGGPLLMFSVAAVLFGIAVSSLYRIAITQPTLTPGTPIITVGLIAGVVAAWEAWGRR